MARLDRNGGDELTKREREREAIFVMNTCNTYIIDVYRMCDQIPYCKYY